MNEEIQLKIIVNGFFLAFSGLFTYLNLNTETMILYLALLMLDFITGLAKAATMREPITYHKMRNGAIAKICLFIIPVVLAIPAKMIQADYHFILTWGITILALSEAYSIIGNIYTVKTKETLPEYEVIAVIGRKIKTLIERLEGGNNV